MKLLWPALAVVLLSGCSLQKICLKCYPPKIDTVRVVTTHDSLIYRDTLISLYLPGDTIRDSLIINLPCTEPLQYIPDTVSVKGYLATASAWYSPPVLRIRLIEADTLIQVRLDSALREAHHWRNEYLEITKVNEKRRVPTIYRIAAWSWIGVFVFILFSIVVNMVFKK